MTQTSAIAGHRAGAKPAGRLHGTLALSTGAEVLVFVCALSVAIGVRDVSAADIWAALQHTAGFGATGSIEEAAVSRRIPRTVLAALAGAALAVAGCLMQGATRNPLADPGLLGINMGASLAIVLGLAFFGLAQVEHYILLAILGAGAAAIFVQLVGSLGRGGATPLKLALAGVATTVALSSFVTGVVLGRNDIADGARSWQIGGVGGARFEVMAPTLPLLALGFLLALLVTRKLNTIALGDALAAGLGENVGTARLLAGGGAVILAGTATALCGPIGFVGLVVPHLCRLLVGVDYRWLVPLSALTGAILLTSADIVGRLVARPGELDVGIVTALVGAPVFIAIVRRQRVRAL